MIYTKGVQVLLLVSLLFSCVLGSWQGNFTCEFTSNAPTDSTNHIIPINPTTFSSVAIVATGAVSIPVNFSLSANLQAEDGTEYVFTSYNYVIGDAIQFVAELDPCTISSFKDSLYSLRMVVGIYGQTRGVTIAVNVNIFVYEKVIQLVPTPFQTYSTSDYLKLVVPSNYSRNTVGITINSTSNAVPITRVCWNSHTCPASNIDCSDSWVVDQTNSSWSTSMNNVAPGTYYLLLDTAGYLRGYTIFATVTEYNSYMFGDLLVQWYYVLLIAVGCIVGTSVIVSLICWRKSRTKTHYIPIQDPTETPSANTQYKIVVN